MEIIDEQTNDYGICLIDVYRAPSDLYDSWDIVAQSKDGSFPRKPNAGYGPDATDRCTDNWDFEPVHVIEEYSRWNDNGWTKAETIIKANGAVVASRKH